MNAKKLRLLVIINPNASRAVEALPNVTQCFAENTSAIFVVTKKKKDLKRTLRDHGESVDRIVLGGGDGTISKRCRRCSS